MRFYHVLMFLFVGLLVFANCGEDSQEVGSVQGVVLDEETGNPIESASVTIGRKTALTDANGEYILNEIPFSDELAVAVVAANYKKYEDTISLDQDLLSLDISLATADGRIQGIVTNKETGKPIAGASVRIGDQVISTGADGEYALEGMRFSDEIDVVVTATSYREYRSTISLRQEFLLFNVDLVPVDSPSAQILEVLETLSSDIETLDPSRIPSIQSCLAEDYVAASDPAKDLATIAAIMAGVVPPDYDALPNTIENIVAKYDRLEFDFVDPSIEFDGDSASVLMRFEVYAETKPPEPKRWEIVIDGRLDLRKQNGDWKITYWRLIPPFLKFEEEPL